MAIQEEMPCQGIYSVTEMVWVRMTHGITFDSVTQPIGLQFFILVDYQLRLDIAHQLLISLINQ